MFNYNGVIGSDDVILSAANRGFLYGDGVFETVRILNGKILFFEDHYFRLMSSMRILRMEIPMEFTMDYLEKQVLLLVEAAGFLTSARVRLTVYRNGDGYYLPRDRSVSFIMNVVPLSDDKYLAQTESYEIDIYKDFYVTTQLLSSIKSTNRIINITGSIYASENGLDNCLLLNDRKNVVEALQGNVFMLTGSHLVTPPISEGCVNGVMRKQILTLAKKLGDIEVSEAPISPFDLQKADEIFITNVIIGVKSVTKYRKKNYVQDYATSLIGELNELLETV